MICVAVPTSQNGMCFCDKEDLYETGSIEYHLREDINVRPYFESKSLMPNFRRGSFNNSENHSVWSVQPSKAPATWNSSTEERQCLTFSSSHTFLRKSLFASNCSLKNSEQSLESAFKYSDSSQICSNLIGCYSNRFFLPFTVVRRLISFVLTSLLSLGKITHANLL